jgi:hypothetical protein
MKLEALAEVDQARDDDTMAISKFLAVSASARARLSGGILIRLPRYRTAYRP